MAIRVAINHKTEYRYDRLVSLSPHVLRLRPAPHSRTPIHSYSLKVEPGKHFINWQQDPFGNYLARLVFLEKTRTFKVEVDLVAEMTVINPFDFFVEHYAENYPFEYDEQLKKELIPYREIKEDGPLLNKWLKDFTTDKEHNSNLVPWHLLRKLRGVGHGVVPSNPDNSFIDLLISVSIFAVVPTVSMLPSLMMTAPLGITCSSAISLPFLGLNPLQVTT